MIQEFRIDKHRLLFDLQPEQFMSDHNLLWYGRNNQWPEPEVIHVMLRALKDGDCAIDAGANVGFFTVLMSKIVGDRGKILAVEPDSRNVAKLKKNLDINSCENVEIWPFALAGTSGMKVPLHRHPDDNGQTSIFGQRADTDQALTDTDTFDRASIRLPKHPSFLKMDIEGSEVAALLGARNYAFPCIVTEINDKALKRAGHSAKDLFTILRERGYVRYQIHVDGSMPSRIEPDQDVVLTRENANFLFAFRGYVPKQLWPQVTV